MRNTEMGEMDRREWLLTNGLGSFASGTVCDAHTRTYHGWLIAALDPPSQRTLLLSRIDAVLELDSEQYPFPIELATNFWGSGAIAPQGYRYLQSFTSTPVPTWVWGQEDWQFQRQLILPYGLSADRRAPDAFQHRVLVQYRYEGKAPARLALRPLMGDRSFHHQQNATNTLTFVQLHQSDRVLFQAQRPGWWGTPWQLRWQHGTYTPDGIWYLDYLYPEETQRGLADCEDLYSPGSLTVTLQSGEAWVLEASVLPPSGFGFPLATSAMAQAIAAETQRYTQLFGGEPPSTRRQALQQRLWQAGDRFVVYRASIDGPTVIAGYPWFNDWGRDTLIALPGLALTTQRFDLARGLLHTFGTYCRDGLIPNAFPDAGTQPFYNSIDASLWWIETLGIYLTTSQDWEFLGSQYPVVRQICKAFMAGTLHNIGIDATDGLVTWEAPGVALTWMDAVLDGEPVTPRCGKPVEINALWYSCLCWAHQWAKRLHETQPNSIAEENPARNYAQQADRYAQQAKKVKAALKQFWNPQVGYFFDRIAPDDRPDAQIRPNAVIALSLSHCGFETLQGRSVLQVAQDRLLTPYGLRSLDPSDPDYIGRYTGHLKHRDRAYHQGTVWSWLIGPFIRAWKRFYPERSLPFDPNPLLHHFEQDACLNSISEIFDGDAPHPAQGAIAQAWSVAELIRHWQDL